MPRLVWLEVALNGPWSPRLQPRIPVSVADIVAQGIACVREGAAIVHMHAYDPATGRQRDDADTYAAIIEGIRSQVDAIVYPTLPLAGGPDDATDGGIEERFAAVERLARRNLIEWLVVDPGSVNFAHREDLQRDQPGFVYLNPESHIRTGLSLALRHQLHPSYACYEPGFVRMGAALHKRFPGVPQPVYRLMFSDDFAFGYRPTAYALDSYRRLLQEEAPQAPWMIAGLAVDTRPLFSVALGLGAHLRVGLEDARFGCTMSNVELVENAVRHIEASGGRAACPAEIRDALRKATHG